MENSNTVTAAVRHPEGAAAVRRQGAPRTEQRTVVREIPLQDAATLETEWSALQRRRLRMAPDMERCGEPLY